MGGGYQGRGFFFCEWVRMGNNKHVCVCNTCQVRKVHLYFRIFLDGMHNRIIFFGFLFCVHKEWIA